MKNRFLGSLLLVCFFNLQASDPPQSWSEKALVEQVDYLKEADHQPVVLQYREKILQHISSPPEAVWDLGCGVGGFLAMAHKQWPSSRCLGVDSNPYAIEYAQKHVDGVVFLNEDLWSLLKSSDHADLILLDRVLLVFEKKQWVLAVESALESLEKSGQLIIVHPQLEDLKFFHRGKCLGEPMELLISQGLIDFCTNSVSILEMKETLETLAAKRGKQVSMEKTQEITKTWTQIQSNWCIPEILENLVRKEKVSEKEASDWSNKMESISGEVETQMTMVTFYTY